MAVAVNLNDSLAPLLANGSLADLQGLIDLSLQPKRILEEIAQSKRYEALPLFLPLLHLEENEEEVKILAKMMAEAVLAQNKEVVDFLQKHLQGYVNAGDVAFFCGQLDTALPERESLAYHYQFRKEYVYGLISADNLDLLLLVSLTVEPVGIYIYAGTYCAKRIMDHSGYSSNNVYDYVSGAFSARNQDTISHLFKQVEDKDDLHGRIKQFVSFNRHSNKIAPFACWLFREGFLQFSEEDWIELKPYPELYNALQADV